MNNERKVQIINDYKGLIVKHAHNYYNSLKTLNDIDVEDVISEIQLHLICNLDNLDEEIGVSMYVDKMIQTACLKYIEKRKKLIRQNDFTNSSTDIKIGDKEQSTILDLIKDECNIEEEICHKEFVKEVFEFARNSKGKHNIAILEMYLEGKTYEQMGTELGTSRQNVEQSFKRLIKKIRKNFINQLT